MVVAIDTAAAWATSPESLSSGATKGVITALP